MEGISNIPPSYSTGLISLLGKALLCSLVVIDDVLVHKWKCVVTIAACHDILLLKYPKNCSVLCPWTLLPSKIFHLGLGLINPLYFTPSLINLCKNQKALWTRVQVSLNVVSYFCLSHFRPLIIAEVCTKSMYKVQILPFLLLLLFCKG